VCGDHARGVAVTGVGGGALRLVLAHRAPRQGITT
jgi:hypothetical protein